MKRVALIIVGFMLTAGVVNAQVINNADLLDQNPNHQKSKDKYTKPISDSIKNSKPDLPPSNIPFIEPVTSATLNPITNAQPYLNKLKRAEETFVAKGNYKNAYEMALLLKQTTDSLYKQEAQQKQLQHQFNKRLLIDSLKQIENNTIYQKGISEKQAQIDHSKNRNYLISIALLLAVLVAFFLYRSYRNTKKTNRIIQIQKQEVEAQKQIIESSLLEKETLLKEIHHRVKNNLQIVSSLLNLQANRTTDDTLKKIMTEAKNRVTSMAMIHQKIYQSNNLSSINFQSYIEQMAQSIESNFNNEKKDITTTINTNHIVLDIDTSIPLGLIINELLTNIYKYAFAEKNTGNISITLQEINNEELELHISDNGIGLPPHFDINTLNSLGLKLVKGLSNQIKGSIRFQNNNGAHCYITFKKPAFT